MYKIKRTLSGLIGVAVLVAAFGVFGTLVNAQSVLQGYSSEEKLQKGMLVALKEGDEGKIVALTNETASRFKGVIVDKNDSPVTISSEDHRFFVATSGPYEVLVSNERGAITKGDYISVSSNPGIGAKTSENQEFVIGIATSDFGGGGEAVSTTEAGGRKASVGRITIDVAFSKNPNMKAPEKDKIPDVIQKFSNTIAEKPVSNTRIYIASAVLLITAFITGTMLYGGVRNAIISIGRNPLSKGRIIKGLIQVIIMALIIFIVGVFGVYLIIKL